MTLPAGEGYDWIPARIPRSGPVHHGLYLHGDCPPAGRPRLHTCFQQLFACTRETALPHREMDGPMMDNKKNRLNFKLSLPQNINFSNSSRLIYHFFNTQFRKMKVSRKIMAGFIIAQAVMVVVGIVSIVQLMSINGTVAHMAEELAVERQLSNEIDAKIISARYYANRYIYNKEQTDLNTYKEEMALLEDLMLKAKDASTSRTA
jgi:hypothetical protein